MHLTRCNFSIDYFGAAGSGIIRDLLDQSSNQRKRKVALHNLARLATAAGSIPRGAEIVEGGLYVNKGGVIQINLTLSVPEVKS